jgi:hypothetical protein
MGRTCSLNGGDDTYVQKFSLRALKGMGYLEDVGVMGE